LWGVDEERKGEKGVREGGAERERKSERRKEGMGRGERMGKERTKSNDWKEKKDLGGDT